MAVARAYGDTGRDMAAARLELCGVPSVGYSPAGELLRSKAGVPTAILMRCGSQLCSRGCAGDISRRRRRVVMERVTELMHRADPRRPDPLFQRQPDAGATIEELLEAVAEHGATYEAARKAALWERGAEVDAQLAALWDGIDAEDLDDLEVHAPDLVLLLPT